VPPPELTLIQPTRLSHRALIILGLVIYTITAYCSEGFYHPDEHFQLLEFANYKLGQTPAADLPWEFPQQIRPTLQPTIALVVMRAARAVGISNPFIWALLLRLLSAWLAVWVFVRMSRRLTGVLGESGSRLLLGASFLLWFMPFLSVRFSSENWSALSFLFGLSLLPLDSSERSETRVRDYITAGFALGLSFVFRFQMGFALAGVGLWVLIRGRFGWARIGALVAGGVAAIAMGTVVDWWFYGNLVFTPWRYFASNIIHGAAASFGVAPWWWYFPQVMNHAIPVIAIPLIVLAAVGIYRARDHLITWAFVAFVVGHIAVSHKELRFLFPMAFPLLFLAVVGWQHLGRAVRASRMLKVGLGALAVVDFAALLFVGTRAADNGVTTWRYLYDYARHRPTTLYVQGDSPYAFARLHLDVYRAPLVTIVPVDSSLTLADSARVHPRDGDLFLPVNGIVPPTAPGMRLELAHRSLPSWMLHFDVTHWEERTHVWTLYRIARGG
jgi:phosphatidylinositol glycan class B